MPPLVITIDGPAGSGKSTAARLLAKHLGLAYLDTGATYRALAYAANQAALHPVADVKRITALARRLPLTLRRGPEGSLRVVLGGADVTRQIRTEEVSETAALISQHPAVRAAMVRCQRALARAQGVPRLRSGRPPERSRMGGVVAEGRDTGSVVFPRAPYKFFLEAAPAVRARRRQQELRRLHGYRLPLAQVQAQLHFRDGLDLTRRAGPLVRPRGAVLIDTSQRSPAQVVRAMLRRLAPAFRHVRCATSSCAAATRSRS